MTRGIWLSAAVVLMLAAPAAAQNRCMAPVAPVVPDGRTATAEQLVQANRDVVAFIRASDEYQSCLLADLQAQQEQARRENKPFDPAIRTRIEAQGEANQSEKERVGNAYNQAVAAYRAAHPR